MSLCYRYLLRLSRTQMLLTKISNICNEIRDMKRRTTNVIRSLDYTQETTAYKTTQRSKHSPSNDHKKDLHVEQDQCSIQSSQEDQCRKDGGGGIYSTNMGETHSPHPPNIQDNPLNH